MTCRRLTTTAAALVACASLARPARGDGLGLRVGDTARLHATLETELRWDSMAGIGSFNGSQRGELVLNPADLVLHLRPGVRIEAPGAQSGFNAGARLDYTRYSMLQADTSSLSYLGILGDAELVLGRDGPTSFTLADHFSRSDRTTNPALGVGSLTDSNVAAARLNWKPGGGAIEGGLGYAFLYETYEQSRAGAVACTTPSCDGTRYSGFGSQTHRLSLDARWRFLPKTALTFEASIAPRSYAQASTNVSTLPLRALAGLAGLVTEKVRVVIKAGYENLFAGTGANFSGPIGQLELGWDPRETVSLTLGVLRTAEPVSDVYGWYDDLRGYATGSWLLLGRLSLQASLSYDHLGFGNQGRTDSQLGAALVAEWELTQLLRIAAGEQFTSRDSTAGFAFSYTRSETFARLTVAY